MEMLSADTPPENSDSDRFPTLTCRPSASVSSDSSLGRNVFASIKKGIAISNDDQDCNDDGDNFQECVS